MAFSRHNIEKRRLIDLVCLNPILWDCRLPHYKRSDKKKALKWNELGRVFGVSGERVQRTFTSLREIFRRELNHEKMLGVRFKSKWEYYDAMAFLKEVIRERKSRERNKTVADTLAQQQQQHSNNNSSAIDEYQYFAPNDPNNPNNQPQVRVPEVKQQPQSAPMHQQQLAALPSPASQIPLLPLPGVHIQQSQQLPVSTAGGASQKAPFDLASDVILNLNANAVSALQHIGNSNGPLPCNSSPPSQPQQQQQHQQQQQLSQPSLALIPTLITLSSSRSSSSSPSIYIKEEPDSPDDTISLTTININEHNTPYSPHHSSTPLTVKKSVQKFNSLAKNMSINKNDNNSKNLQKTKDRIPHSATSLVIDEDFAEADIELDGLDDPDVDTLDDGRLSPASTYTLGMATKPHHSTAREILYAKFGDFLAARLNTLNETMANDLMNRILLLIAEK